MELRRLKNLVITALAAAVLAGGLLVWFAPKPYATVVLPWGERWRVEIAKTPGQLTKGLSGRPSLSPGSGLLMVFGSDGYHGIWMKDMNFPIDIIWLNADMSVVKVENNAQPADYPRVYAPNVPSRYVLEVPAGAAFRIKPGDKLRLETVF